MSSPTYLIYYTLEPIPWARVVKQIVFDTIATLLMGVVGAWLYRNRARGMRYFLPGARASGSANWP